jgi:hypothetical protein
MNTSRKISKKKKKKKKRREQTVNGKFHYSQLEGILTNQLLSYHLHSPTSKLEMISTNQFCSLPALTHLVGEKTNQPTNQPPYQLTRLRTRENVKRKSYICPSPVQATK